MIVFAVLNGIIVSLLFIYGCFIIFAIIQDYFWNHTFAQLWLYVPQIIPCFTSALGFYVYLAADVDKALLISVMQFPLIYSSTYSMFVADDDQLEMSQEIFIKYDIQRITKSNTKMKGLPLNIYLVYGLFRLLKQGYDFSTFRHREVLPELHPHLNDVIAKHLDLYKLYKCTEVESSSTMHKGRIFFAKEITMVALILIVIMYISLLGLESSMLSDYLIAILCVNALNFIFHMKFSIYTVKVLMYLGTSMPGLDVRKYKVALVASLIVMVLETIIFCCLLLEDNNTWTAIVVILHSFFIFLWYTNWIYEQISVSFGG